MGLSLVALWGTTVWCLSTAQKCVGSHVAIFVMFVREGPTANLSRRLNEIDIVSHDV
jgi:hypothetical protein